MEEALAVTQMRAGNTDAFNDFVERYQAPIQRYLYRLTGDSELAKDLTQDTFMHAYKKIMKENSPLTLKTWIYRIATNCARKSRRRARLLSFIPLDGRERDNSVIGTQADRTDIRLAIGEALCRVSPDQRICMVLHFIEGFKYQEIADILSISDEAVRKRVARGSREFKKVYNMGED